MTKIFSQWQTLTVEHDRNIWQRQTLTLSPKNMLVWSAWTGPPAPACKLALSGTPAQPHFTPLQEKTSGTEVRRTPEVRLRFVGFNFRHVQLLMFVVVVIRSYSFWNVSIPQSVLFLLHFLLNTFNARERRKNNPTLNKC